MIFKPFSLQSSVFSLQPSAFSLPLYFLFA